MLNVESHVLRYWEEELEIKIPRNEMGHRYYTEGNIESLRKVRDLKKQGYSLKAIKNMVNPKKATRENMESNASIGACCDFYSCLRLIITTEGGTV